MRFTIIAKIIVQKAAKTKLHHLRVVLNVTVSISTTPTTARFRKIPVTRPIIIPKNVKITFSR